MKLRSAQGWILLAVSLLGIGIAFDLFTRSRLSASTAQQCQGEYADSLQLQSVRTRDNEQGPKGQYSYLIRSTARYECPFFGPDGKLRRRRVQASELGTAFAYESNSSETFLLTNEHVAVWPEVTDSLHKLEGIPEGCKRMEEKLRIVRDERDDFEPGQIPLTRVAVDPLLDAAVLKAAQKLNVIPYKIGKSASLRQGNAVRVRGFPLGVMQAVSDGRIVNPYDRDQEQGWDHVDFVVDALLSEGNSGSPVLAVSCASRELQLVGMYHAGYKGHSALNVAVGIDQLTELMRRKRRVPRALAAEMGLGTKERARVVESLHKSTLPLFDFGGTMVHVEESDGLLLYHLYGKQFPLDDRRALVIEDLAEEESFGEVGRLFVPASAGAKPDGGAAPWRAWPRAALGAEERDLLTRSVDAIRLQLLRTMEYRRTMSNTASADDRRRARELSRLIARNAVLARDLASGLLEMTDRLAVGHDTLAPPAGAVAEAPPSPPAIASPGSPRLADPATAKEAP
jgi:S1-C subfamily serine protease